MYHYGIKGQHWGERRFQNEDGSLTEEGRRRYGVVGRNGRIRYSRADKENASKELSSELKKNNSLKKRIDDIESSVLYDNDKIYNLYSNAHNSDKYDEKKWAKFETAYKKELSKHKDYSKLVDEYKKSNMTVNELRTIANSKSTQESVEKAVGAIGGLAVGLVALSYMSKLGRK